MAASPRQESLFGLLAGAQYAPTRVDCPAAELLRILRSAKKSSSSHPVTTVDLGSFRKGDIILECDGHLPQYSILNSQRSKGALHVVLLRNVAPSHGEAKDSIHRRPVAAEEKSISPPPATKDDAVAAGPDRHTAPRPAGSRANDKAVQVSGPIALPTDDDVEREIKRLLQELSSLKSLLIEKNTTIVQQERQIATARRSSLREADERCRELADESAECRHFVDRLLAVVIDKAPELLSLVDPDVPPDALPFSDNAEEWC